jgi:hypothetical protein
MALAGQLYRALHSYGPTDDPDDLTVESHSSASMQLAPCAWGLLALCGPSSPFVVPLTHPTLALADDGQPRCPSLTQLPPSFRPRIQFKAGDVILVTDFDAGDGWW